MNILLVEFLDIYLENICYLYSNIQDKLYDEIAKHQDYDLILYSTPDVPWVDDGTRRHGESRVRKNNDEDLKEILDQAGVKYKILKGNYTEKFEKAVRLVDSLIS